MAYNTYSAAYDAEIERAFLNSTVLRNAEPNLVYGSDADLVALPKHHSDTVVFYQYNKLGNVTQALQEGRTPVGQLMARRTLAAKTRQYGAHIGMTDLMQAQLHGNPKRKAAELLGAQAGRSLDALMRDVFTSTTTRMLAGGKTSRSQLTNADVLTVDDVLHAMVALEENMAYRFPDGCYHCVTMPRGKLALQKDSDWREVVDDSSHRNFKTGELDTVYGAKFKVSQQGKVIEPDRLTVASVSGQSVELAEAVPEKLSDIYGDDMENPLCEKLAPGATVYVKGTACTITAFTPSVGESAAVLTLSSAPAGTAAGDSVITDDTTPDGLSIGLTLVYGAHAFGRVDLEDGGIQMITHELGSAGTSDPLNMAATCAWKVNGFAATILNNDWAVAIEHAI